MVGVWIYQDGTRFGPYAGAALTFLVLVILLAGAFVRDSCDRNTSLGAFTLFHGGPVYRQPYFL